VFSGSLSLAGELPAKDVTATMRSSIAAQSAEQRPAIHRGKTARLERPHTVPTLLPSSNSTFLVPAPTRAASLQPITVRD
jgi:hypothetical protein